MALTDSQKAEIRRLMGFADVNRQYDIRLEAAMNALSPEGEVLIVADLAEIVLIRTQITDFRACRLKVKRVVGEVELLEPANLVGRVEAALAEGYGLVTLEEVGRLLLPAELGQEVRQEMPEARLLLQAWQARSGEEQEKLKEVPPEPFYLREAYITTPKKK